jgi:hypothetical protein
MSQSNLYLMTFRRFPITNRRVSKLITEHNGDIKTPRIEIEVCKKLNEKGETFIMIFEIKGWYLVCTKSRGALKGHPHCIMGRMWCSWWSLSSVSVLII